MKSRPGRSLEVRNGPYDWLLSGTSARNEASSSATKELTRFGTDDSAECSERDQPTICHGESRKVPRGLAICLWIGRSCCLVSALHRSVATVRMGGGCSRGSQPDGWRPAGRVLHHLGLVAGQACCPESRGPSRLGLPNVGVVCSLSTPDDRPIWTIGETLALLVIQRKRLPLRPGAVGGAKPQAIGPTTGNYAERDLIVHLLGDLRGLPAFPGHAQPQTRDHRLHLRCSVGPP